MNNFHHLLPLYSQHTQELVNSFLLSTIPTPAQGPFFNYGLFGGIILQISLCFAFAMALINTGSFRRNQSILLGLLVLYTFFVQSGLTSPAPWILLGIWLSPPEKC